MTSSTLLPLFTRRTWLRMAASTAVMASLELRMQVAASQTPDIPADHPAIGAWLVEYRGFQPPAYMVFHPDGTGTFFTTGTAYFTNVSDPTRPMSGVVVWEPVDATSIDAVVYVTWGDATDETSMTIRQRWTFDADGASALTRATHTDAEGVVINRSSDRFDASRLPLEPFEEPATPVATPVT